MHYLAAGLTLLNLFLQDLETNIKSLLITFVNDRKFDIIISIKESEAVIKSAWMPEYIRLNQQTHIFNTDT